MKPTILFLMNSIDLNRGGLTKASLKQASFFAELGYESYMLTFNFNARYPFIRKKLLEMNKVHKKVIIRNMYEEFEGNKRPLFSDKLIKKRDIKEFFGEFTVDKRAGHNAYRLFKNGLYVKYIAFNNDNSIRFIDYFDKKRYRTKREDYDPWGNLKKVSHMDLFTNKPRQLIYYDNDGNAFLTQWNDPTTGQVQRIILFNKKGAITKTFINDDVSHKILWLKNVVDNINNDRVIVVSDTRSTDEVLVNFNHPKVAKIWRLHSGHLGAPYTEEAEIADSVKVGLDNIDTFDGVALLTEEQKKDLEKRIGVKEHIKVIPHFHEIPKDSLFKTLFTSKRRDPKLGIVISRLSTLKRIDHIIKAFEIVHQKIPNARLEIWGIGDEESNLKNLIKKLKLNQQVVLKGFTQNPDNIYQTGIFSVVTSKQEGFCLSILESMYNQTPVISYNIKYGPSDMIEDGKNGFLVDNSNIEQLADKMLFMFENPSVAIEMGKKAKNYIDENFGKNIYEERWLELIDFVSDKKFR